MSSVSNRAAALRRSLREKNQQPEATSAALSQSPDRTIARASRVVAQEHREAILQFVARVGYATTRQVAKAVWGKADKSARICASRSLKWLTEKNLLVRKRDGDTASCEYLHALTRAGVYKLNELDLYLPGGKAHGRDWLRYAHSHRTACNDVFASIYSSELLKSAKLNVHSELEIRAGVAPLCKLEYKDTDGTRFCKIPDLTISGSGGIAWVEVENTYRNESDLRKVLSMMRAEALSAKPRVARFIFYIAAKGANRIGARLKKGLVADPAAAAGSIAAANMRILREMLIVIAIDRDSLIEKVLLAPSKR